MDREEDKRHDDLPDVPSESEREYLDNEATPIMANTSNAVAPVLNGRVEQFDDLRRPDPDADEAVQENEDLLDEDEAEAQESLDRLTNRG